MAFDAQAYLAANPDLVWAWENGGDAYVSPEDRNLGAFGWAEKHYNTYGQAEGRSLGTASTTPDRLLTAAPAPSAPQPLSYQSLMDQWLAAGQPGQFQTPDGKWVSVDKRGAGMVPGQSFGSGDEAFSVLQFNVAGDANSLDQGTTYDAFGNVQQFRDSSVGEFLLENAPKLGLFLGGMQGLSEAGMFGQAGMDAASKFVNPFSAGGAEAAGSTLAHEGAHAAQIAAAGGNGLTAAEMFGLSAAAPAITTSGIPAATTATGGLLSGAGGAAAGAAGSTLGSTLGKIGTTIGGALTGSGGLGSSLLGAGATLVGGALQNKTNQDIANKNNEAINKLNQDRLFRPVGFTTRFGNFGPTFDANGRLISANYTLNPELRAMQDRQMGMLPGLQSDYERAVQLGRGYLAQTPEQLAAERMKRATAIVDPVRQEGYAQLQNRMNQQGTMGLSVMGGNPQADAFWKAVNRENTQMAYDALAGGQQDVNFGLGLMSSGYKPFATALGGAQNMETLGQGAMDIGTQLGAQASTAGARLQTPQMPNQVNPWAAGLMGGLNAYQQYQARQPLTMQNPYVPQQPVQPNDPNAYTYFGL